MYLYAGSRTAHFIGDININMIFCYKPYYYSFGINPATEIIDHDEPDLEDLEQVCAVSGQSIAITYATWDTMVRMMKNLKGQNNYEEDKAFLSINISCINNVTSKRVAPVLQHSVFSLWLVTVTRLGHEAAQGRCVDKIMKLWI